MVLVGVAALTLGVVSAVVGAREFALWQALRRVRAASPDRVLAAALDGRLDGRLVAVAGVAGAGREGVLSSAVNDEPCVWHRRVVHNRQISYHATERGTRRRQSRRRRVADTASKESFTLMNTGAGTPVGIEVHPEGMRVHRPIARPTRVLPGLVSEPFPVAEAMMGQVQRLFWHREWVLPAGVPLFVLGEVYGSGPRVSIRRPPRGPHIVTTLSSTRLRWRTTAAALAGGILAPLAILIGAVSLIVHFV